MLEARKEDTLQFPQKKTGADIPEFFPVSVEKVSGFLNQEDEVGFSGTYT